MEFYERKYLGFWGGPFVGCCCGCSLRTGVIIIGILDIIVSLISGVLIMYFILGIIPIPGNSLPFTVILYLFLTFLVCSSISAGLGIGGVNNMKVYWIYQYFYLFLVKLGVFLIYEACLILALPDTSQGNAAKIGEIFAVVMIFAIALPANKVIWSAYVRLENNEAILVQHGKVLDITITNRERGSNTASLVIQGKTIQGTELKGPN